MSSGRKGKIDEILGNVTGDRRAEAKGRVEQSVADPSTSTEEVSDDEVDREIGKVRKEHGDI